MTDRGRRREHNEDAFLVDDRLGLFLVCDGAGGRSAGAVASALAVESIHARVHEALVAAPQRPTATRLGDILRAALEHASQRLRELARADPRRAGMSTTASALCVADELAVIGHVGDSRVYHARDGLVRRLTADPTRVNHPGRRALGLADRVEVDIITASLRPGDRLLLCTDGLADHLDDAALARLLALDLWEAGEAAVHHADRCGGEDNITALFIDILAT